MTTIRAEGDILPECPISSAGPSAEDLAALKKDLLVRLQEYYDKGKSTLAESANSHDSLADPMDIAAMQARNSINFRLRDREHKAIRKIHATLRRMENGEYGMCDECGDPISIARLRARPMATLCIDCKNEQELDEMTRQDEDY